MEKVDRHREHHQPRMALQVLDRIEKKHPKNPWVLIERASIHLDENESDEAKAVLEELHEAHPNHQLGIVLRAIAVFDADGFEVARPLIYEAFLKCYRTHNEMLSSLALNIAMLMAAARRHMGARHFLTLAMRLAPDESQQEIFLELLRFDSSSDHFYPLRSVHQLIEFSGAADLKSQAVEAGRLAELGCCEPAAEVFTRLGEEQPDCAIFWQNAGLCRAWAGDEESAADAFHAAAQLHDDFDTAVELETMAQLLDLANTDDVVNYAQVEYRVESASKLLSQLPQQPRIVSLPLPPEDDEDSGQPKPVGMFQVLDRDALGEESAGTLTLDAVANVVGDVAVFDADPQNDLSATAFLSGLEGAAFDSARELFEQAAGDVIEAVTPPDDEEKAPWSRSVPAQIQQLHWQWQVPPKTPGILFDALEQEKWREVIEESWMTQPQDALRGKSPRDAMDDEDLKLPLTASVYALDALCDRSGYALDIAETCNRLNLRPLRTIELTDETPLNAFSAMQLNRLPVKDLNDAQLTLALNRSLLLHHSRFLYDVLIEALSRPSCAGEINLERAYMSLAEICKTLYRRDEAIEWVQKGAELEGEGSAGFQQKVVWKLRELTLRLDNPEDALVLPLLDELYNQYGSKLPELQEQLDHLCDVRGIQPPWRDASAIITSAVTQEGGGEKKLWLPGQ